MKLLDRIESMVKMRSHIDPPVCQLLRDCYAEIVSLQEALAQDQMSAVDLDAHRVRAL